MYLLHLLTHNITLPLNVNKSLYHTTECDDPTAAFEQAKHGLWRPTRENVVRRQMGGV
jgi:hypothetical protein